MMPPGTVIFYPRELAMWRGDFCHHNNITLTPKDKTDHKVFASRSEFVEWLKGYGVQLDDATDPLTITATDGPHPRFGHRVSSVTSQWTLLGWLKDL